jgi:hypothetical protein
MQEREIEDLEKKIEEIEILLGSNNQITDSEGMPVNLDPISKRLSDAKLIRN